MRGFAERVTKECRLAGSDGTLFKTAVRACDCHRCLILRQARAKMHPGASPAAMNGEGGRACDKGKSSGRSPFTRHSYECRGCNLTRPRAPKKAHGSSSATLRGEGVCRVTKECRLAWSERHDGACLLLERGTLRVPLPPHPAFGHLLPQGEKGEHGSREGRRAQAELLPYGRPEGLRGCRFNNRTPNIFLVGTAHYGAAPAAKSEEIGRV